MKKYEKMRMAKRLSALFISIILVFNFLPSVTFATGLEANTSWYNSTSTSFTITTASQLAGLASLVNAGNDFSGKTITLGNNINLNSEAWTPIGTNSTPFKGTFDGQGYTVQDLSVSGFTYAGFFGYADGDATIKNVTITGSVSGTRYAGGIVGYITSGVTVENCINCATISTSEASAYCGGVVGYNNSGTVSNCTSAGTVTIDSNGGCSGGVVGYNYSGTVSNCSNTANVSNSNSNAYYTGGVVGYNNSGTISNSYNTGAVSGGAGVGGVVCLNNNGTVSNCYNTGTVSSGNYNGVTTVGGVVALNDKEGSIANCYNTGTVSGGNYTGGVAGESCNGCYVTNCYYLTGAATAAIGVDNGTSTSVAVKTSIQFASGEVAYLLNGNVSGGTTWYQNIDNGETMDDYPVLDNSHGTVYCTMVCDVCYSNNNVGSVIHVGYDAYGFCTNCGGYQPATLNTNGVYEISNAGQLFWFASLVNGDTTQEGITAAVPDASAVLTNDIDLSVTTSTHTSIEWTPIGSKTTPFSGTFDGGGYTVSGMSITTASDYMGLFGYVSAGTIKNLTVSGKIDVTGSSLYAGGIVGTVYDGTLSGLTSTVTINGTDDTMGTFAGVVATAEGTSGSGSTVEKCTYSGSLTARGVLDCIGGIVGYINVATINDCLNTGTVDTTGGTSGKSVTTGIYTSGIVGYCNNTDAVITNCLNLGTISDASSNTSVACYTGAIIGRINSKIGSLSNCYYLSGTADAGCGGNGSKVDVNSNITVKTADEFATGEVAWLLQGNRVTKVWGQDLTNRTTTTDDDLYPVFNDDWDLMVLQISFYYKLGNTVETDPFYIGYTNYAAALPSYPTEADATYVYYTYNGETYTELSTAMSFGDNENVYVEATYAVIQDLGNIQSSNTDTTALRGSSYSTTLMGVDCYVLPDSITVTSGGTELTAGTDYTYDSTMGEVTISKVMGKIVITADATNISHSYDGGVVTTEPTCTDEGVMTYSCTVCGETRTEVISATGHSYTSVVTDPTCMEKGYTTHTCTTCGHSYTDNETEATGHSYTSVVTAPTCTEEGYTTHTCSVCGDTYVDSKTEATGHSWDEGVITTAAGCTAEGVRTYTCTVCGETRTEAISATGHTAGEVVKENEVAATCTKDGSYDNVVYCTVCGAELSRDTVAVPAKGHSYTSVVTDLTCTEKGYTTHTCTICGHSYTDNETEATGHSWDEGVITTETACTSEGVITYTCTVCGETKTVAISATGHTHGEAVIENEVAATCTEDGSYESVVYCTVCGAEISRETITVPATGHSYTSVVTDPTCTEKGYSTHTCSICGDTYTDSETEATGHTYEATGVVASTYTEKGYTVYTCTGCGDSYEADYTDIRIIDGTDDNLAVKTVVQELTEVPEGLREIYESVEELIADMESRVLVSQGYTEDNTLVIDVVLQYRINGGGWINATADNFPNGGITVTLDYPDGTDSSYDFMVVHMFTVTSERLGITAGEVEMPEVTKTDEGLVVTLNGLSPVMISWKEVATEETSISEEETTAIEEETSAIETETTSSENDNSNESAQTGDARQIAMLFTVISLIGLTGAQVYRRRKRLS